jgi:hypothetical protein
MKEEGGRMKPDKPTPLLSPRKRKETPLLSPRKRGENWLDSLLEMRYTEAAHSLPIHSGNSLILG